VAITKITRLPDDVVSTAKMADDGVLNAKVNPSANIDQSKISSLSTSLSNICSSVTTATADNNKNNFNIGLLGFKMAVNESLTVFNLIDGVVDEFQDESGTDEAEGSNDNYCATSDYYDNVSSGCISAGFAATSITEPDTSTTQTIISPRPAPTTGDAGGSFGTFTVPDGMTSVNIQAWGAGSGGGNYDPNPSAGTGGGGGYAEGTLTVTSSQVLHIGVGEGGGWSTGGFGGWYGGGTPTPQPSPNSGGTGGGGLTGVFDVNDSSLSTAPQAYLVAGSGGGGGFSGNGGAGGGLTGCLAGSTTEQTSASTNAGGGGDQEQGGQGGNANPTTDGSLFTGGTTSGPGGGCNAGSGGAGYFGGGGGQIHPGFPYGSGAGGGGGSSFYGHPQITSGSTEEGSQTSGGGTGQPNYVAGTNEGNTSYSSIGEDGYVLLTGSFCAAQNTTIISSTFTSTSVATNSRIVVFEENIDTPTLNTDIIASVSRDGTNFTTATLSDSGYVTGSSGQRILTGQADISGQPSGQSMRWKLQLANNQVKIHGVSLSWA